MDPLAHVSQGEAIFPRMTAQWWNEVTDAVKVARGGQIDLAREQLAARTAPHQLTADVVNKAGADILSPGGVLKLSGPIDTLTSNPSMVYDRPLFKGVTPTGNDDYFALLPDSLLQDGWASGVIHGFTFTQLYYSDTSSLHTKAAPGTLTSYLVSGNNGLPIIWREKQDQSGSGTAGLQWALVFMSLGVKVQIVAITSNISGATWDSAKKKLMQTQATMPNFTPHTDNDGGLTYDPTKTIKFAVPFGTGVTLTAKKFKVGVVVDGVLSSVDCNEFDLPTS
jgi:hypothetical protein